ncbi:MAG: hypothetical protein CSA15_08145 [Candidatus Delongbacteria bacterium]|nr:MAG: hypothetical protein CSA15_08145 [Candidatus Delongbacteria bacterium]
MGKYNWNEITLNSTDTGYLVGNKNVFKTYQKAMSFHPEGVAAVYDESGAYHINTEGCSIYERRYIETFGYYCNIATVRDKKGFFHIDINGNPIYKERYLWCGNFQENICVVRSVKGYFHIDKEGNPLYNNIFSYVGDFKYGIAVVYDFEGNSFHIDKYGNNINNNYYKSAQNYHKGFAVVEDQNGFFHVDKLGKALYSYRLKKIEPFYNGWAFGEDFEDRKLKISENGVKVYLSNSNKIINSTNIIDFILQNKRVMLFFRHSERYEDNNIITSDQISLTEKGKNMAQKLGMKFNGIDDISFFSSPIERCYETLKFMAKGLNIDNFICKKSEILGAPGIYFDRKANPDCGYWMNKLGYHEYCRQYLMNGYMRGSKDLTSASEELLDYLLHSKTKLSLFNSHDFLVAAFMIFSGVKYPVESDFVDYLEGVAVVIDRDNSIYFYRFKEDLNE